MIDTERAVERLTEHHTEFVEGQAVEWPPLLVWLRERITEKTKRGVGAKTPGLPLNDDALELLRHIETQYRLICDAISTQPMRDLTEGVKQAWAVVKTDRQQGVIDDVQWERITSEIESWVAKIEQEQDRPRKMELTVPCPRCDTRWVQECDAEGEPVPHGERKTAVVIEFAPGKAPVAECRAVECGAVWAGWADMARLGFTVGAQANVEILKAAGIDTPELGRITSM